MGRAPQLFADDLVVGFHFRGAARTLTTDMFSQFAALTGDAHPIHYDEAHAANTRFGRPLAHGLLLTSLTALGATSLSRSVEDSMVAMLELATGVRAFSVGKPSPVMMRAARKELGLATDETTIIGDTVETDILGGVQLGYHTVLVLSGGTRPEDLQRYAYRPEIIVDSLAEFSELLEKRAWHPPWHSPNGVRNSHDQRSMALARS